jgi:putative transposase
MIDRGHKLSIRRQAQWLIIIRGAVSYLPKPVGESDLTLMNAIDKLHLDHPFMGSRQLRRVLCYQGLRVAWVHVRTLMRKMGICAVAPQPGTSQRHPRHKVFPYLLRQMVIKRSNQVWALDMTYMVFARFGRPEIVNTDQDSQFTAQAFVDMVQHHGVKLSMDGRGAWRDNVFVERIWRTVKYERVYLRAYETVREAKEDIAQYIDGYNMARPHSSLGGLTPKQVWISGMPTYGMAA